MKNAIAHIGGTSKDDLYEVPEIAQMDHVSLTKETEAEKANAEQPSQPSSSSFSETVC